MPSKTNKISIYLLKPTFNIDDVLKREFQQVMVDGGIFYYDKSHTYKPSWAAGFFGSSINALNLLNQSSKGVFFTNLIEDGQTYTFAIPFGYGHSMINKSKCVDNFGLKLVLNIVARDSIRKIGKRTLSSDPKNTIEQLSKIGAISDFGIDIEQDLVEEVTGKPKLDHQERFGKNLVTGKTAFTASVKVDLSNAQHFLSHCLSHFQKEDYKQDFEFIDQVREIKDAADLNETLIQKLRDLKTEHVQAWMAIPEIIEWEDVEGFSYKGKKSDLHADISLIDFLNALSEQQLKNMDIDFLKRKKVTAFRTSNDEEYDSWSAFQSLYCEITENDRTVILTNGKWYEINKSFVDAVNDNYEEIMANSVSINLLNAKIGEHEDKYNSRLADSLPSAVLMDRKNISFGGGSSSIEFCDVYDAPNRTFIHVKNYYGSSALSHLFAQGRVSGQLFLNDMPFRKKVKEKEATLPFNAEDIPTPADFKVVFGIISESQNALNLPFFSKVNLKNEKKMLEAFGFKEIFVTKVQRV